ncbi:MAG TPA: Spy/CpxP family protein refolding chaperone [Blastocatellia bacterium]|nr:Spy/CpxP family protein refolding chaperone [Blastocatellia bacterium]
MEAPKTFPTGIAALASFLCLMCAVLFTTVRVGANNSPQQPGMQNQNQTPPPPPPGGPGPRGFMDPRMMNQLNLSEDQRQQIHSLMEQMRTDSETYQQQMKDIHEGIRQIVENKQFDEQAARALTNQQANIEAQLSFIRIRTDSAIYRLLTDDQRAKLEQLKQQPPPPPPGRPHPES